MLFPGTSYRDLPDNHHHCREPHRAEASGSQTVKAEAATAIPLRKEPDPWPQLSTTARRSLNTRTA